jgi:membrane protein insertase Oxa1/YidC/SpoIIIJ
MPAAIGVYWIFKSVLTSVKQIILHKAMPVPQFTEEDYKAAERELAGKSAKKGGETGASSHAAAKGGIAPVRSLHHIDDEDFEDTREQAEIRKRLIEEAQQKAEEAKKNKNVPGMKATNRHDEEKADKDSADGKKD